MAALEFPDMTSLCLVVKADGVLRELEPRWVAASIAHVTGIRLHQIAAIETDVSLDTSNLRTQWIFKCYSHEDQKRLLHNYRILRLPGLGKELLETKLDFPNLSLTVPDDAWITIDEDQDRCDSNRHDSVQSTDLFGSECGDKKCPGSESPKGLVGPGEWPSGVRPQNPHYPDQPLLLQYPSQQYSEPSFQPKIAALGHPQNPMGSDPYIQLGREPFYQSPSNLLGYPHGYLHGDGGPLPSHEFFNSPDYQQAMQPQGYEGMDAEVTHGFSEMSFNNPGCSQPGPLGSSIMDDSLQSDFVVLEHEAAKRQFYLRVTELPSSVTEQELWEFFQDRTKCGGGPIQQVVLDPSGKMAAIYFTDAEMIQRVVQRSPHLLRGKRIIVEPASANFQPTGVMEVRTVEIRGIEDEDFTEMCTYYFENPAKGGGEIENSYWNEQEKVFYITFVDSAVARDVSSRGHKVGGKVLEVTLYDPQPEVEDHRMDSVEEEIRTVQIRGIDDEDFTEMCTYYFENPAKGGGEIEESRWEEAEKMFYITFVDAAVAKEVVSRVHKVGGKMLDAVLYEPPTEAEEEPQCTVEVRGFDPALEDLYEMYFENPKKCGGSVKEFKMNEDGTVIYVTFESPEDAERAAAMSHVVGKRPLEVILAPREKPDTSPPCTVKVTGGDLDLELYTIYFENSKKGGGTIENITADEKQQAVFITFADPEVAESVCSRPHKIRKQELQVTLHIPKRGPERQRSHEAPVKHEEEEKLPLRMVEVTSSGPLQSEDTYLYYFENPRNGGDDVEEVNIDEEKEVVYVTFVDPAVAEKMAGRSHKIGGQPVQVKLYVPPKPKPAYPNKLLFHNVADSTSKDCLAMYIERITGLEPVEILYGDDPGVVLITFGEEPDFAKTQAMCHKRKLEGRQLALSKVPISNCLLVEGLHPNTTEDTVALYFENKRRGGGGPVEKVEIAQEGEQRTGFVYFEDHEVLGQVLTKEHKIDGRSLQVKCYMECLGLTGGSTDPTIFGVPKPIILKDVDKFKVAFIRQSAAVKDDFTQQLLELYAAPKFKDNTVTMECKLTKDVPQARILARTWTNDTERATASFFGQIDVHRRDIMQTTWPEVEKVVGSTVVNRDEVVMFPLIDEFAFVVVGKTNAAKNLFEDISKKVKEIEEELERKKQEVTETNGKLKPHQLRLLAAMSFHTEAIKRHSGLSVDIKVKKGEIIFHGMMHDVREAQVDMYQLLNSVKTEKITDLSDMQKKLLEKVETRNVIVQKFKPQQVVAVWEVGVKEVTIHAFSDDSAVNAVHIIRKSVVQHICQMTPESAELLRSTDWHELVKMLMERNGGKLLIAPSHDNQQVYITGTYDVMHGVVEDVENFIQENAIYSEVLRYSPSRQRFVAMYWQNKLQHIKNVLKAYKVNIALRENQTEIYASGTSIGLDMLKKKLQDLEGEIIVSTQTFSDPGKVKFLTSGKCDKDLDMLGRSQNCIMSLQNEPAGLQVVKPAVGPSVGSGLSSDDTKISSRVQLPGGVTVSAVQGDITQMNVDVIVNAANGRMDHIGGLARVIVDKAGKGIQEECYRVLKAKGGQLREGDVLVSGAGRLPCKAIIHAVGPMYGGGRSGEEDTLHDTVVKCLETANGASHVSIAIPALSTGIFHYPVPEATLVIVEGIKTYLDSHRRNTVKEVYLCHLDTGPVQHFCKALKKVFPSAHSQPPPLRKPRSPGALKSAQDASGGRATGSGYRVINVNIKEGEIAKQTADVIVNSTSNGLDLKNGAVSSSILKVAGSSLQDECRSRYPNGIVTGDIAVTSSFGLNCQKVFHLALCNWSNPNAEQLLGQVVTKCLTEASKCHFGSIAFPVLGTGNLGYPRHVVANTMLGAVHQFQQDTPSTSLREAHIVIYHTDKEILQEFRTVQGQLGGPLSPVASSLQARGTSTRQGRRFNEPTVRSTTSSSQQVGEASVSNTELDIGGLKLIIKPGDITEEAVDAIVNSSNGSLDLSRGAVASALRHKCGPQLEGECKMKAHEIQQEGIVVSRAYNLNSKIILHIDAERFCSGKWEEGIKLCLQTAEDTGVESLALPALGTGGYGMSASASAKALFTTLTKFSKKRPRLREVRVVLFDKKMIPQYIGALQTAAENYNKDNKGFVNWMKGLAGLSVPEVMLKHSSPFVEAQLFIYADSQRSVQSALNALDEMVKEKFTRKELLDETLMNMSTREINELKQVAAKHNVEVTIQTLTGRLVLDGLHNNVFEAMQEMSQLIRASERRRQNQETADMLANMVQWCYLEVTSTGSDAKEYGKKENHIIETAYQNKKPVAEITDVDNQVFVIDFNTMMEYPKQDPRDCVGVIRRDKIKEMATGNLPETWARHDQNEHIKLVSLQQNSAEYQSVEKNLRATLKNRNIAISEINRIQNPTLYRQYEAKKAHLEKQNQGIQNEKTLWHGTAVDAMDNINMYGFNRSYCGKNATVYGQGVYFAIDSHYSTHSTYSPPDSSGKRYVYQSKVLVGYATTGNQTLRFLPTRLSTPQGQILYDSVTDNLQNPKMYVIFNDTQAYPEYLITFTGQ